MKIDTNFLCDLWMALFQFSNDENINEKECTALVDIMSLVEKVLVLKLQDDVPNIVKILAVLTDFGDSELPHSMDSLLRAYAPTLENTIAKVA
ncbi:hypothetical protein KAE70_06430 [Bartonella henselae]|uniref:hypothetical protein n=1 Tax=Bartonella henselae TaxID=38323 RepID=UPI000968D191|nr:hypothetical protein [Bartonella henselae]OLL51052.1 hypothetical protein AT243_07565 [Bartonella henselae]OLL52793.1 hypothetical protein AT239_03315 [Bartonella henselae]UJM32689.1 hypothetical protein KAE70_06430 [Bartonella henselae]UJM42941.1 hypothetical protein KAE73_06415 [Bartonella henselae]